MARSWHTDPPRVTARRADLRTGMARARVIERRPLQGDIHPIPKKMIDALLVIVPAEYVLGLRQIELRARQGPVGQPYAEYSPSEKTVRVYSVPMTWERRSLPEFEQRSMRRFGAHLENRGDAWLVRWGNVEGLSTWFAFIVLFHEPGHHFAEQYRRRRGRIHGRRFFESDADARARHILRAFIKRLRPNRRVREEGTPT